MRGEQSQGNAERTSRSPGILYLVGVPIGHPDDVTVRALQVLRTVDLIAAKDTRATQALLAHHGLTVPLTSYHRESARDKVPLLLERLERGRSLALLSDCGMPGVYDIGALLVRKATQRGIPVEVVPGPSAVTAAAALAGQDGNRFVFEGACPTGKRALGAFLRSLVAERRSLVLFLAARHVRRLLKGMVEVWGDRHIVLAIDLTTERQQVLRGRVTELLTAHPLRFRDGRITAVVEGARREKKASPRGRREA